jgi:hypothetical protein
LYGLTIEFYLDFYELLKDDLLKVVQELKRSDKVLGLFKTTHLDLIPRKKEAFSFEDYRSISCCNVIYKIISKIIANRINPLLNN